MSRYPTVGLLGKKGVKMTNEQFIQEVGKAKIDKVLKFVFTDNRKKGSL